MRMSNATLRNGTSLARSAHARNRAPMSASFSAAEYASSAAAAAPTSGERAASALSARAPRSAARASAGDACGGAGLDGARAPRAGDRRDSSAAAPQGGGVADAAAAVDDGAPGGR